MASTAVEAMTCRIASVETFIASYPVVGAFKFFKSISGKPVMRDTVMVKITDHAGHAGWGQSVPSHTWSYETLESVRTTIDGYLGPALIGMDAFDTDAIWRVMNQTIAPSFSTGQPICKAGVDLALFDLTGRVLQQSAPQRWQRQGRSQVSLSWTVDCQNSEEVPAIIVEAHGRGFHNFNVKVGRDAALDLLVCRQIRKFAPNAFVWVDANGGYDEATALAIAPQLADLGIAALEQPLPANRLTGYQRLRRQKALPILMDEAIVSLADLQSFHQLELLDGVAMKVSRCGGLTEACRVLEYMEQHGLLFFASGLTDPDLSLAASLLLYSSYGLEHPAALNAPQFLSGSFLKTPLNICGDQSEVPVAPGLGVEVDEERFT
ncbi:MAG: enolase C-terminal domain-like protein [Prosthecobacter sp.]|nr:enolase C-terminal domain-like protein [Prosthecobacter sp.]